MTQDEVRDALDNVLRLAGSDCMNLFNHVLDRLSSVESAVGISSSNDTTTDAPVEPVDVTPVRTRGRV